MKTIIAIITMMLMTVGCYQYPSPTPQPVYKPSVKKDVCWRKYLHCVKRHHWKSIYTCDKNLRRCDKEITRHW